MKGIPHSCYSNVLSENILTEKNKTMMIGCDNIVSMIYIFKWSSQQ